MATPLPHAQPLGLAHAPGSFLSINGVKLWHEEEGSGEPGLLIAGGPGASHTYMHGFSPLSKRHRLIYFDALGCGKSDETQSRDRHPPHPARNHVAAPGIALTIHHL